MKVFDLHERGEIKIQFHYFICGCLVLPIVFVEERETVFLSSNALFFFFWHFVKKNSKQL